MISQRRNRFIHDMFVFLEPGKMGTYRANHFEVTRRELAEISTLSNDMESSIAFLQSFLTSLMERNLIKSETNLLLRKAD